MWVKETPKHLISLSFDSYKVAVLGKLQVIDETLRMANVGLGNFRKALEDIKIKGMIHLATGFILIQKLYQV